MVPFVELKSPAARDDTPPNALPMEFPSWTRAGDHGDSLQTRSANVRRRGRRGNVNGHKKRDGHLDNRGLLKDIAKPVVSGIVHTLDEIHDHFSGSENSGDDESQKTMSAQPNLGPDQPSIAPPVPLPPSPTSPASPTFASVPTQLPPTLSTPQVSKPTGAAANPAQPPPPPPPPAQVTSVSQYSSSELSKSSSTTTSSRSLSLLTPILTAPVPTLSPGGRKGVDYETTSRPALTLTKSSSSPTSPQSSSTIFPTPSPNLAQDSDYNKNYSKGNVHPKVEMALIALGSVGSTIILVFLGWLIWRCHKRRGRTDTRSTWKRHFAKNLPLEKPKLLVTKALSRVPIIRDHIKERDRGWANLGEADLGPFNEKTYLSQSQGAQQPRVPAIVVQTDFIRSSIHYQAPPNEASRHMPKESISSVEAQFNGTFRPGLPLPSSRLSDISSLSSGFGDGQLIMDTLNSNTNTVNNSGTQSTIHAPLPAAKRDSSGAASHRRDTVYTEASEDLPPRFRSVNSWVRQQTGRIKRAKQRDEDSDTPPVPSLPPEQDLGLMMPDGEEPRRADTGVAR